MNCSASKEELYDPPPAYSTVDEPLPPSYICTITRAPSNATPRRERPVALSPKLLYYLVVTGILHLIIGSVMIFCNIRLLIQSEPFHYVGFWAGLLDLLFSVYLAFFIAGPHRSPSSLRRFRILHIVLGLIILSALILSSIELSKDYSSQWYIRSSSVYNLEILLLALLTFSFLQMSFSSFLACLHFRY